jgi:Tfp pilus assembly protein FimT
MRFPLLHGFSITELMIRIAITPAAYAAIAAMLAKAIATSSCNWRRVKAAGRRLPQSSVGDALGAALICSHQPRAPNAL